MNGAEGRLVLTIGHSTRTLAAFIELLKSNKVTLLADIRTIPRSRHNPQYNLDGLPGELGGVGVKYRHMAGLGGLRHPASNSPNVGWRNTSFRGFADYMQTREFEAQLDKLINLSTTERVCLMCAEALPWRCHRSLIADALLVRGLHVEHIISAGKRRPHVLTPWAEVQGATLTYPAYKVDSISSNKI
jgi:uncharacterized protein (DUF488 family)